jgi:di/tricarboxylate transporter
MIKAGDTLYCRGGEPNIDRFAAEQGLTTEKMTSRESDEHFGRYGIAEAYIIPNSKLINNTISESRFREKYNVNVLGIKHKGEYQIGEVKDIKLHPGDALLMQGPWEEIAGMAQKQTNFVVVGQPAAEAARVTLDSRAPVAAGIMLLMIVAMALNVVPGVTAVLCAAMLMVATGCLRNMEEAYSSINWSSIVLIGSMIPLATAFEKTGVTAFIAQWFLTGLGDIGPGLLLAVVYLATSVLTMFMSNTATAVLFAPIAMQAAAGMGVNPYPYLFAVAVAASMCFASPFSTPPNALVMSAGKYTFKDYIKVGLPLQIVMGIVMVLLLPLIFPFE